METTTLCLSCRYCTHASRSEQSAFQRYYSHCIEDCCFEKKAEPSAFVDCKAPSSAPNDATSANDSLPRLTEEGLQTPIGNGGSSKQYKWTQTLEESESLDATPSSGLRCARLYSIPRSSSWSSDGLNTFRKTVAPFSLNSWSLSDGTRYGTTATVRDSCRHIMPWS